MSEVFLLGANKSYDKNKQTVVINQVVVSEGFGWSYVVYDIQRNGSGFIYQLVNTHTHDFNTSCLIRPLSEKFGIGIYYDDANPQFLEPKETADLLAKAKAKKEEKDRETKANNEESERLRKIGEERLRILVPDNAIAVIVGKLQENESDLQTDYHAHSTSRTVILGFSTHTRNLFSEMRKVAGNFEGTAYLSEFNANYENRETYTGGYGMYLGKSKYSGWIVEKQSFLNRDQLIQSFSFRAGKEENICIKSSTTQPKAESKTAITSSLGIEIVDYSDKAIAVFGDTKPIKDVLRELNGLFRTNLTYNGEKRAGWIYSKRQEAKVRETLKEHGDIG